MPSTTSFWRNVVLAALQRLGGEADLLDLYNDIERTVDLTELELEASPHHGRPRYQHTVRATVSQMARRGRLLQVGRGRYRLHEAG